MEWISVDYGKPKEYTQIVLVARHSGCGIPSVMPAFYNGHEFVSMSTAGNIRFVEPTHWMPLPPPPEVE